MKQYSFLFFLFFCAAAPAQITISQSDMPQPGTAFITTNAVVDLFIDPEETGSAFSWDFSNLVPLNSLVDTFTDASGLPAVYQIFFFGANLVDKKDYNISFDQISLEDVYYVYKNSSANLQLYGYAGTFDGIPIPIIYSSKDIIYNFPVEYGDVDSSDSGFEFGLPGLAFISQQRKRVNRVDGWGTVKTPIGTFDALRVKSVITDVDSVFIDSISSGTTAILTSYEYKWLSVGSGIPIFQINAQEVLGAPIITQILYQDTTLHTAISVISPDDAPVMVFPDPASDYLNIQWPDGSQAGLQIFATDISGKVVYEMGLQSRSSSIAVSNWANGIYFLRIISGQKVFQSKVFVAH